jgi:hypothetical protein
MTSQVVVDSGGGADRDRIVKGFSDNCIPLEKVNVLLSTSLGPRTSGNDDLFTHALHHVKRSDWGKVKGPNPRRVIINTPFHWIDKYMKIVKVVGKEEEGLVLLVHFPRTPELLEPSSRDLAGKVVGIMGDAFFSASDPSNTALLSEARRKRAAKSPVPNGQQDLSSVLQCCDVIVPGQGDPIALT